MRIAAVLVGVALFVRAWCARDAQPPSVVSAGRSSPAKRGEQGPAPSIVPTTNQPRASPVPVPEAFLASPDESHIVVVAIACAYQERHLTLPERRLVSADDQEVVRGIFEASRVALAERFPDPSPTDSTEGDVFTQVIDAWNRLEPAEQRSLLAELDDTTDLADELVDGVPFIRRTTARVYDELIALLGQDEAIRLWMSPGLSRCVATLRVTKE